VPFFFFFKLLLLKDKCEADFNLIGVLSFLLLLLTWYSGQLARTSTI